MYKCNGPDEAEWHKEEPMKVVFPHNCKNDGTLPRAGLPLTQWIASKGRIIKAITNQDYQSYTGPIPLDLAKQWDLRKLSKYLINFMTQAEIDVLYPEPTEDEPDSDGSSSDDDSDSE